MESPPTHTFATPLSDNPSTGNEGVQTGQLTVSTKESVSLIENIYRAVEKLDDFVVTNSIFDGERTIVIYNKQLHYHPPFGMTPRCRIAIKGEEYIVHVLMREMENGIISGTEAVLKLCSKYSTNSATHKFCPGLDISTYKAYKDIIRFDIKSVRQTTEPFARVDSVHCLLWFDLGCRPSLARREAESLLCSSCVRLRCDLERQVARAKTDSPSKKAKQHPSSHAPLMYMSPESQLKRKQQQKRRHDIDQKKLRKYEQSEISLDGEQHDEMCAVVTTIEEKCSGEMEELISEGIYNILQLSGKYSHCI